jgi:hypothetical protein
LVALLLAVLLFSPIPIVRGQTLLHTISSPGGDSRFGQAMASVGDVNADGNPDFVVGAPFAGTQGRVSVVLVTSTGTEIRTVNHPDVQAPFSSAVFGWSVAGLGDVNGDGVPDFAVGAPGQSEGTIFPGRVHVFSGSDGSRLYSVGNPNAALSDGALFGWAVASVGDLDGDGVPELAVGAPAQGANSQGQVFVFSGVSGSLSQVLDNPGETFGFFGGAGITGVGDVNGDGIGDIAVGAPDQDGQGRVFVFSGASGAPLGAVDNPTPQASAKFGEALVLVGDVNSDGLADLAVGAPRQNGAPLPNGGSVAIVGRVFVFPGVPSSPVAVPFSGQPRVLDLPVSATDPTPSGASFGQTLAAVGDYDSDGVVDVAVGAPNYSIPDPPNMPIDSGVGVGKVFLFSGANSAALATLDNPGVPITGNANFGHQVAVVEKAGGGVRYLTVSAPAQLDTSGQIGQAFVYSLPDGATTPPPPPPPVNDTTPPVLQNVPGPQFVEATSSAGALVNYPSPTATDNQDPAPVVVCTPASGRTYALGSFTVNCTARDSSGNAASASFQVTVRDSTPPDTTIPLDSSVIDGLGRHLKPGSKTLSTSVTIEFSGTDAVGVAGYQCAWDGGSYAPCSSPLRRSGLKIGTHTFVVRAVDLWNNTDPSPATFQWTILSKGQAAKELKRSARELELSRREKAKLTALLREIKARLTDRRSSNDKSVCGELDAVVKYMDRKERTGVLTSDETAPLRHLAESLKASISCRAHHGWHAGHRHR